MLQRRIAVLPNTTSQVHTTKLNHGLELHRAASCAMPARCMNATAAEPGAAELLQTAEDRAFLALAVNDVVPLGTRIASGDVRTHVLEQIGRGRRILADRAEDCRLGHPIAV